MEDSSIVDLYWSRSEQAISETSKKYGRYCFSVAFNILQSNEDSEECVMDTYMRAWNAMPDERPRNLKAFLARITRNLALNMREKRSAEKRASDRVAVALDELHDCIPATDCTERVIDDAAFAEIMNRFLSSMTSEKRKIFMRRYFYMSAVEEIAKDYAISESKVKMSLLRSRNDLKRFLEKEGITL